MVPLIQKRINIPIARIRLGAFIDIVVNISLIIIVINVFRYTYYKYIINTNKDIIL